MSVVKREKKESNYSFTGEGSQRKLLLGMEGEAISLKSLQWEASWGIRAQPQIDFINTVRALPIDKISAIWEMGFGSLQSIGCPQLHDQVWKMMVDGLEPLNETVVIHGKTFSIHASDFERIMGVRDGGLDVGFSGDSNTAVVAHVKQELAGLDGNITLSSLKEVVLRRVDVDQIFRVAYALYAMSALLCPTNSEGVDYILLMAMITSRSIGDLNWATYCFSKLMDGVLTRSRNDYAIGGACFLFLQVFYFEAVGTSLGWVDKTITPVIYWGVDKAANLVQFVKNNGGFTSENNRVWAHEIGGTWMKKNAENYEGGITVEETVFAQVEEMWSEIESVKNDVHYMKENIALIAKLGEMIEGVRTEILSARKENVTAAAAEVFKQYKPQLDHMLGVRPKVMERAITETRSNSAHFNGGEDSKSKGDNSQDSSCMILYCNNVNGQTIHNDQVCLMIIED